MKKETPPQTPPTKRRFGKEREASRISGRAVRTLQKDRLFGVGPFPHYKVAGQVLYDLDEIEAIIAAARVGPKDDPSTGRAE